MKLGRDPDYFYMSRLQEDTAGPATVKLLQELSRGAYPGS